MQQHSVSMNAANDVCEERNRHELEVTLPQPCLIDVAAEHGEADVIL